MRTITRRAFIQFAGLAVASALIPAVAGENRPPQLEYSFRVRPANPQNATPSELAFCERARFKTAADAMRAAASRRMEAEVYRE